MGLNVRMHVRVGFIVKHLGLIFDGSLSSHFKKLERKLIRAVVVVLGWLLLNLDETEMADEKS